MNERVVILGACFGGLPLSTILADAMSEEVDVTLIDKSDAFVFGFSKLDVMFGRTTRDRVTMAYADFAKPGARVLRETVTAIDPESRRVTTDAGVHEAAVRVIALGADYDMDATPGLAEGGNEFYSMAGAEQLSQIVPTFSSGHAVIGVCGAPFKCRPAPSGRFCTARDHADHRAPCQFARSRAQRRTPRRRHRGAIRPVPRRAEAPGSRRGHRQRHDRGRLHTGGFRPLKTRFLNVWALGDVATAGVPTAGVFAEGAARVVAQTVIYELRGGVELAATLGRAPATSSSATAALAASTSTSCQAPHEPERSTPHLPRCSPKRALRLQATLALVRRLIRPAPG